jgi:L-ascorbate metabolism protein UlaG (beta-lactamase superfamily)
MSNLSYSDLLNGLIFLTKNANKKNWSHPLFNRHDSQYLLYFLDNALKFSNQEVPSNLSEEEQRQKNTIKTYYELFLNLEPNLILEQVDAFPTRRPLTLHKSLGRNAQIPLLDKNEQGKYISFEDLHSHEHGQEASRIGASTQMERLKGWISRMMAKLGVHIFENARYEEHEYLHSTIYADDQAQVIGQKVPSYYWVGHASNLIIIPPLHHQSRSIHILTDPVEGDLFPGIYSRRTKEGKLIKGEKDKRLPRVDVVLISHNHRDHLDISTLKKLVDQQPKMIIPEGDKALFTSLGFKYIEELTWGEKAVIEQEGQRVLEITSVPARHWSGRGLHDAHKSAFAGYVIHSEVTPKQDIYFAGDTAELGEESSKAIYGQFNITLSIQPGGPDENRRDMESTHQSSADGITAHFKNLLAVYSRSQSAKKSVLSKENFLSEIQQIKTVFDHTATFKLGNLRLRDTYYSFNRVLAVFNKEFSDVEAKQFLADHEYHAFQQIKSLAAQIQFDGQGLSQKDITLILERDIIVPKIGQRIDLEFNNPRRKFTDRNLILNRRALVAGDKLALEWLEGQKNESQTTTHQIINDLIIGILNSYKQIWHARFTRTHLDLFNKVMANDELKIEEKLSQLQSNLAYENRHGHLQNIVHYAQWLNNHIKTPFDLEEYLTRLHIRQLIDQQIKITGSFFITTSRDEKIKRFTELANKLDMAESLGAYKTIYTDWLEENKEFMSENRSLFFARKKTQSENAIDKIDELLQRKPPNN